MHPGTTHIVQHAGDGDGDNGEAVVVHTDEGTVVVHKHSIFAYVRSLPTLKPWDYAASASFVSAVACCLDGWVSRCWQCQTCLALPLVVVLHQLLSSQALVGSQGM